MLEYGFFVCVFSDESIFALQRGDGSVRMYGRRNEHYADLNEIISGSGVLSFSGQPLSIVIVHH